MRVATGLGLIIVPVAGFIALFQLDALATANVSATGGLDLLFARLPLFLLITMAAAMALILVGFFTFAAKRRG